MSQKQTAIPHFMFSIFRLNSHLKVLLPHVQTIVIEARIGLLWAVSTKDILVIFMIYQKIRLAYLRQSSHQ